jgi:hypothetical protein
LELIWKGARTTKGIRDPVAFLATILQHGHWIRFEEEIARRGRIDEMPHAAVVDFAADIIQRQEDKWVE